VLSNAVNGLVHTPLLVLSADDGLAALTDALVQAIKDKGGDKVTTIHAATDHGGSDHRIFLESKIIEWLAQLH
jgi:hypothetical protein